MDLGEKCLAYRKYFEISQAELSKMTGVDRTLICHIERGYVPSKRTEEKLLKIVDTDEIEEGWE